MLVRQAEFARRAGVSRKTVTEWKTIGRIVMNGNFVDIDASKKSLANTGFSWPTSVTQSEISLPENVTLLPETVTSLPSAEIEN